MTALSVVPFVGGVAGAVDTFSYLYNGDYATAATMLAVGFIPGGKLGMKIVGKTMKKFGPTSVVTRIQGPWSINDMKQGLLGHSPKGLGKPDLHHADQMPGSAIHELSPNFHRGNKSLHQNKFNQGVTSEMRESDRKLHWWYRAREQGADKALPDWIYD